MFTAATILGQQGGVSPYPLNNISASATGAYSTRKLRGSYSGNAIRVRRSSDNTEQDIGFSGTGLDTSALTSFVGANNGFVTTWYDQSGNSRDFTQSTAANQPQIVASGTIDTTINGNPSLSFTGSPVRLTAATTIGTFFTASAFSILAGSRASSITTSAPYYGSNRIYGDSGGYYGLGYATGPFAGATIYDGGTKTVGISISTGTNYVGYSNLSGGTERFYLNGGTPSTLASGNIQVTSGTSQLGSNYVASAYFIGWLTELIMFNAALSQADANSLGAAMGTYSGASWSNI